MHLDELFYPEAEALADPEDPEEDDPDIITGTGAKGTWLLAIIEELPDDAEADIGGAGMDSPATQNETPAPRIEGRIAPTAD